MSAISSSTSGITALLQQSRQTSGAGFFGRADFEKQRQADFASALQSAGVDSSKISDIQSQIDSALQSVRQNGGSGDLRSSIKDAVNGVLERNGVDTAKFEQALKAQHPRGASPGHPPGGPDCGQSADASSSTDSSTLLQKLEELLKSLQDGTLQSDQTAAGSIVDIVV